MLTHGRNQAILRDLFALGDVLVLLVGAVIASLLRFDTFFPTDDFLVPTFMAPLLYLMIMIMIRGYQTLNPETMQIGLFRLLTAQLGTYALMLVFAYFAKVSEDFSRLWTGYSLLAGTALLIALRIGVFVWLRRKGTAGHFRPRVALICSAPEPLIISQLRARAESHSFNIIQSHRIVPGISGPQASESLRDALHGMRVAQPDIVVMAVNSSDKIRYADILDDVGAISSDLVEISDLNEGQAGDVASEWIILAGLPFLRRAMRPFGARGWWVKRLEDIVLGTAALVILSPLMLTIAIAVKATSRGPVLFAQLRHGFNGETIRVMKFRSMYVDKMTDTPEKVQQARRNDPRITPLGAFLRKTSLDELPQLFNVLRGDMSLVGPRPHATAHNELYRTRIDGYFARHRVKPGITGWAQVNGWRGETDTDEKMRQRVLHDMYYIQNWSPWLDMRIMFLTLVNGFVHRNAY
ncbi:undecaprenyl-phosphate glucose phosphotransferase [Thalassospira sp. TSL5-1]|uniref:undecaprenyl-phosphate glucose phosphotransferase n=1 Tax=Thalassospira sp. TSL5-1 TaxID=1544451 RepID=UPI00093A5E60|nr:undecaprenyl-phosphate glucose phosphotransferase [Thalassospira sp. TSL5-1]